MYQIQQIPAGIKPSQKQPDAVQQNQQTKPTRARNKFTKSEDIVLLNLVNELGTRDWDVIASRMPNRNPRQCRERYLNYLSPNLSHDPWTPEEDRLLEQKLKEFGAKWVSISKFFKNRTDTMLKNRWLVLSRRLNSTIEKKKQNHQQQANHIEKKDSPKPQTQNNQSYTQYSAQNTQNTQNSQRSLPKKMLPPLLSLMALDTLIPPVGAASKSFLYNPFDVEQFTKIFSKPIHAA